MKKWIVLCFILLLSLVLYACGEPELDISDSTGKGYYLNQTGKTSDNAKITLKDENGDSKKIETDNNSFTMLFPRLNSKATYTVLAEKDEKTSDTEIVVPKQKNLFPMKIYKDSLTIFLKQKMIYLSLFLNQ